MSSLHGQLEHGSSSVRCHECRSDATAAHRGARGSLLREIPDARPRGLRETQRAMFSNILVAIDGSEHSKRALAEAADLAKLSDASLTVMTAVPDASVWTLGGGYGGLVAPISLEDLNAQVRKEYEEMLTSAVASVPRGVPIEKVLAQGAAAPAILEQVEKGGHDLVVMGSRGRGEVRSLMLGSVSRHVIRPSWEPLSPRDRARCSRSPPFCSAFSWSRSHSWPSSCGSTRTTPGMPPTKPRTAPRRQRAGTRCPERRPVSARSRATPVHRRPMQRSWLRATSLTPPTCRRFRPAALRTSISCSRTSP